MKKSIIALATAIIVSLGASAQNDNRRERQFDPAEMAKKRTEQMVERYGLNSEQAAELQKLNDESMGKMRPQMRRGRGEFRTQRGKQNDSIRTARRAEMEKRRAERQQYVQAYNEKLSKIMTKEQYELYKKDSERRPRRDRR